MIKKWSDRLFTKNVHNHYVDKLNLMILKTRPEEIVFCFEIQAVVHYFLLIVANRRCSFL